MFALVFKERVVQVQDEKFEVSPSFKWIDISQVKPQPEVGWFYDGQNFSPPPDPPSLTAQQLALAAIPGLKDKLIYNLGRFAAGELTPDQIKVMWQNLKAKLQEAGLEY